MTSAPYFFGNSAGDEKCFFCGNTCGKNNSKANYVKKTFTNHDIAACPSSRYVCDGCVISTGMGIESFNMIDGTVKIAKTKRGGAPRLYSWILCGPGNLAATKAHMSELREAITNPPKPPFAIILADSGQKQIIFRCPVSMSRDMFHVQLEDDLLTLRAGTLKKCILIANKCSAACGKVALRDPENVNFVNNIYARYGSMEPYEEWVKINQTDEGKLAAWLAKPAKEAKNDYPKVDTGSVPPENSGPCRPKQAEKNKSGDSGNMRPVSIFDAPLLRGRS